MKNFTNILVALGTSIIFLYVLGVIAKFYWTIILMGWGLL